MPIWLFFRAPLGTNLELSKMDFQYYGAPFIWVPSKLSINVQTIDFAYYAGPFVGYARG